MANRDTVDALRAQINALQTREALERSSRPSRRVADVPSDPQPEAQEAMKRIVSWANVSERSQHAVRQRLAREGYDEVQIEEALSRAVEYGIIDDNRFAAILIRSRLSQGKGIDGIRRELAEHGIELDDVPGWPEEFLDAELDETERAYAYLLAHPTRSKNKRDGAYRKLVSRGYSSAAAASAARKWSETS